ncbi:Longitudinals lacking protein, isoform G [Portunus trituberculatus]|uniref:Longitudinals lacking protein, isoform G n=1 Tax=Portunus trituberculatus TaxID=210409 RepID=A0A5B7EFV2_PORTR|nr:Longitudinals lacking protein, isoform G [Portunus trituberculatus]
MTMDTGLLSLKWNNHGTTFFHVLSTIRRKESYSDVTLACEGKFYPVHKLVLSTCSEYFEEIFSRTQCRHPVIVLKDVKHGELEALLNYMYLGEVNVLQADLAGLIKAAECLKIKGLAVPDEAPISRVSGSKEKRSIGEAGSSSQSKRVRQDEGGLPGQVYEDPRTQRGDHHPGRETREASRTHSGPRPPSRTPEEGYPFPTSVPSQDVPPREKREGRESQSDGERSRHKEGPLTPTPSQSLEVLDHDEPPIVKTEVLEQPKEENESSEDLLNSDNSIAYNPALQGVGV